MAKSRRFIPRSEMPKIPLSRRPPDAPQLNNRAGTAPRVAPPPQGVGEPFGAMGFPVIPSSYMQRTGMPNPFLGTLAYQMDQWRKRLGEDPGDLTGLAPALEPVMPVIPEPLFGPVDVGGGEGEGGGGGDGDENRPPRHGSNNGPDGGNDGRDSFESGYPDHRMSPEAREAWEAYRAGERRDYGFGPIGPGDPLGSDPPGDPTDPSDPSDPNAPDPSGGGGGAFAEGGVITEPTQGLVGEKGPEAIVPLSSYSDLLTVLAMLGRRGAA